MANTERPDAPQTSSSESDHRRQLAVRANASLCKDGTNKMVAPLLLASYTVAGLPTASLWESGIIYVSNESGGKVLAFSDGTNWRRVTDRAVVS